MNANILQDFRAMQIAVFGAYFMRRHQSVNDLVLEGTDQINIGDNINIVEVSLHTDYVVVAIEDIRSLMPLKNLSYGIITEIIATLKAKALDIANRDVVVNGKGKIVE
jgi:hypothetical protein